MPISLAKPIGQTNALNAPWRRFYVICIQLGGRSRLALVALPRPQFIACRLSGSEWLIEGESSKCQARPAGRQEVRPLQLLAQNNLSAWLKPKLQLESARSRSLQVSASAPRSRLPSLVGEQSRVEHSYATRRRSKPAARLTRPFAFAPPSAFACLWPIR